MEVTLYQPSVLEEKEMKDPTMGKRGISLSIIISRLIIYFVSALFAYSHWNLAVLPYHIYFFFLLSACGHFFRLWSMLTLGRYFTFIIGTKSDHKLIDHGPYRYIMHPSYFGALIGGFFQLMFLGTPIWIAFPIAVFMCIAAYFARIVPEEKMLRDHFKEKFDQYAKDRWHVIPFIW
jgi:protein-S-isoprenylcysteine O-methyltransferase Ste14